MHQGIKPLTARQVETQSNPGRYPDGNGLYLVVEKSGSRHWIFTFRWQGRRPEMGLGSAAKGRVSLADARQLANDARRIVSSGLNPIDERRRKVAVSEVPNFLNFASEYFSTTREAGLANPKHINQWKRTISVTCKPIHKVPVNEITVDQVYQIIRPIWHSTNETAKRSLSRIENILDAAKARGLRTGANPALWKGTMEPLLGKPRRLVRGHHKALPFAQIPTLMDMLRKNESTVSFALEAIILTASRSSELLKARWSEFDLNERVWTVPAARMKMKKIHRVPLSSRMIEILETFGPQDGKKFVFEGRSASSPLSTTYVFLNRIWPERMTVHGFRSTFRDWAAEKTDFKNETCELALAHQISNKTEGAYRRLDQLPKRAELMQAWSDYCQSEPSQREPVP
jgi:integrase